MGINEEAAKRNPVFAQQQAAQAEDDARFRREYGAMQRSAAEHRNITHLALDFRDWAVHYNVRAHAGGFLNKWWTIYENTEGGGLKRVSVAYTKKVVIVGNPTYSEVRNAIVGFVARTGHPWLSE